MFTGIVERTARVSKVEDRPGRRIITVEVKDEEPFPPWEGAAVGESISLSGACLTVVSVGRSGRGEALCFDAVPETLAKTTLGGLRAGDMVNVERSLRAGDRFGGHYVTGHVDGVGRIRARRSQGDQVLYEVESPPRLLLEMIPKGSIAVEGISLTIVDVDRRGGWFSFAVIPHTLSWTSLKEKRAGNQVNIETDAFGKWVLQALEAATREPDAGGTRGGGPARGEGLWGQLARGGYLDDGASDGRASESSKGSP